jgi:hypothetical protein
MSTISTLLEAMWDAHQARLDEPALKDLRGIYNQSDYWKEIGAFIATPARQTGKTTLLIKLAERSENAMIVVPRTSMALLIRERTKVKSVVGTTALLGMDYSKYDLFVDEFTYLSANDLERLLDKPWRSVTMFGTMR